MDEIVRTVEDEFPVVSQFTNADDCWAGLPHNKVDASRSELGAWTL